MQKFLKILFNPMMFIWICLYSSIACADVEGFGQIAEQLNQGPLFGLEKFLYGVCYVVGAILLINAYNKYNRHRRNPQEVPLSTVIVYVILALVIIGITFVKHLLAVMPD